MINNAHLYSLSVAKIAKFYINSFYESCKSFFFIHVYKVINILCCVFTIKILTSVFYVLWKINTTCSQQWQSFNCKSVAFNMNINICIEDMVELLVHVALLLKIKKQSLKKNNNMDMYSSFHVVKKKYIYHNFTDSEYKNVYHWFKNSEYVITALLVLFFCFVFSCMSVKTYRNTTQLELKKRKYFWWYCFPFISTYFSQAVKISSVRKLRKKWHFPKIEHGNKNSLSNFTFL